ncbi:MAG TPA: HNH endonuclease [Dehalococcoidia bacterium]|nr:HNH endonuclease [Dehalococcoidia bacterium]
MSKSKASAQGPDQYAAALRAVPVTENQRRILEVHYHAPRQTVTAKQLAHALGWRHYASVNAQYGRLGRLVAERFGRRPRTIGGRLGTLVEFDHREGEWHWTMLPALAEALEQLGWVTPAPSEEVALPEEIRLQQLAKLKEGAVARILVNAFERNPEARRRCIEIHGCACVVCGFDFGEVYGSVAKGYIHVHHLIPLSEVRAEYEVNPEKDLRPVCPNCHAVIHRRNPPFSIEDVQRILQRRRG